MRVLVLFVVLIVACTGCKRSQAVSESTSDNGVASTQGTSDPGRMNALLTGKWRNSRWTSFTLEFREGTAVCEAYEHRLVGEYKFSNGLLTFFHHGQGYPYGLESNSLNEIVLRAKKHRAGIWTFSDLEDGCWRRVPPLEQAKERKAEFEKKRTALQSLRDKAIAERDGLIRELRNTGVTKPADLKGNYAAQGLAGSLVEIDQDIEKLDRQIATADSAVRKSQALILSLEREKAGISDEDMRKLAEQLGERTDGTAKLVTPLDVEAAVEKALK